jgi:hypothetical protein
MAVYNTRGRKVDYKQLNDPPWPKEAANRRQKPASERKDKLYPVEIVERDSNDASRVKIRYIGYSTGYDEWRNRSEIVDLTRPSDQLPTLTSSLGFSLYDRLASKIKNSLRSPRKSSPEVRIDMDFDYEIYNRDMKSLGQLKEMKGGNEIYSIVHYGDLDAVLGPKWFIRGLNDAGDFCYTILNTVRFYLRKKLPLTDYQPHEDGQIRKMACIYVCKGGWCIL